MNKNIFIEGLIISVIYLFFRFLEMRFILKENKPLKLLLRDALVVYVSFIAGNFIYGQLEPLGTLNRAPEVFTNKPDF